MDFHALCPVSKIQNCRIQNPKTVSKIQNCRIQKYPKLKTPYPKIFKNMQKYPKPYSKFHRIQKPYPKLMKISKTVSKNIENIQNRIQNEKISKIQSRKTFIQVVIILDIFGFAKFCIRSTKCNVFCFSFGYFWILTFVF